MRLSKSKVLSWNTCPYRFKVESVDGWRPTKIPAQLKKGIAIHEVLEDSTRDSKTVAEVRFKAEHHKEYAEFKEDIDAFINWQNTRGLPIYIEKKFFDEELNLSGIVDRVDLNDKGELVMVDYKSGKGKNSLASYRFELAIYAYLFEKEHNQQIKHWGIYFTGRDAYLEEPVSREEIIKAVQKVIEVRKEIKNAIITGVFPKKFSALCGWCSLYQNDKCKGQDEKFVTEVWG